MRNISLRFWILASVLVAINIGGWLWVQFGGGGLPRVRLLAVTPIDNTDNADRFTFTFDEPLIDPQHVGHTVDVGPFEIEPAVAGKWQWAHPDQAVYLLDEKLPPGRQWSVRPAANFESLTRRTLVGESEYSFRTQALELANAHVSALDRSHFSVELKFNQPVSPSDVLRLTTLTDAVSEKTLKVSALTQEPADHVTLRATRPASGQMVVLSIDPALTSHQGNLPLGPTEKRPIDLGQRFRLIDVDVARPGLNPRLTVWLEFSRRLDSNQTMPRVAIEPAVEGVRVYRTGDYLKLSGPFQPGTRYQVKVPATLMAKDGRTLGEDVVSSFEVPDRRPSLNIPVGRGMLMPDGNLMIDMKAVNVSGFGLTAHRVHANNLVSHLRGESTNVTSREFAGRKIKLDSRLNETQDIAIDLRQLLEGASPGIYAIEARATQPYWLRDRAVVGITNLAITAKKQRGGYHVWVSSLKNAKPVSGVNVTAMTHNNQSIREAVTDENGFVELAGIDDHPDGDVWLITAQQGDDLCYLRPDRRKWVLDEIDQSGREHPTTYDAMLYTERGIYRPGDTVHLTGILREPDGQTPPAMPLELTITRPDGRKLPSVHIPAVANAENLFHVSIPTDQDWQTGSYTFAVTIPGSKASIGQASALIEAFVPVRMEVKAKPTKPRYGPGESTEIAVNAAYLFGQPAAELPVAVTPQIRRIAFKSKRFANYHFNDGRTGKIEIDAIQQMLDAKGTANVKFDLPAKHLGLWKVDFVATVNEVGGRSVSANTTATIDTVDRHLGLLLKADKFVLTNRRTQLGWCLVDGSDRPLEGDESEPMRLKVERLESEWQLQEVNGRNVWKVRRNAVTVVERDVPAGSVGELAFQCEQAGSHRLTLTAATSKVSSQLEFYAVERASEWNNVSATTPERLRVELERDRYSPGESARVLVHSPFKGTLMLTVETDRVVQALTLPMVENTAVVDLPVDHSLRGGAFISATVVRAIDPKRKQWLPHRAMGIVRLRTNHEDQKPSLVIDVPEKVEPGETVDVVARIDQSDGRNGMLHLWAVDDGILLTTDFRTPNPHKHFFADRRGFVTTSDTFGDLMPDQARPESMLRIGGDGGKEDFEGEVALRRNPVPTKQREAAVVWASAVPVGADGEVRVPMTMPKMTGRMRLMAVYVVGDQYTSEQRNITLTSPLLAEWSWPRFAAPGDRFDVPVKVFNTTSESLAIDLRVDLKGPVVAKAIGHDGAVNVDPGQTATRWYRIEATGIGPVDATLHARASSASIEEPLLAENIAALTIRPIAPLHADIQFVRAEAGKPIKIEPSGDIQPKTAKLQLHISGNPTVQLRPAVEQLLDYPYGCVEQTTSRLMAIVHAHELIAMDQPNDSRVEHARAMVDAGIARLWSMQTTSGGLSYWPGGRQPMLWGTAYAASFLVDAKSAGFKVNTQFIKPLMKYLSSQLKSAANDDEIDDNTRALLVRVLATFDQPDAGWMARLSERVKHLDIAGRANLAAAWLAVGRKDKAKAILLDDTLGKSIATTTSYRLTSQVAQEAVMLKALLELDPGHEWIPRLVLKLNQSRKQGGWGTTVSNAAVINALSAYQTRVAKPTKFKGSVLVNGERVASFDHVKPVSIRTEDGAKSIQIETEGKGDVYITTTTRGLAKEHAIKPFDTNLRVRRRWLDRHDKPIDPTKLKVGDLVFVYVDLEGPQLLEEDAIDNIAIVDALPAGLEVDNPRLSISAKSGDPGDRADRVEFLDDRVVLFASATRAKKTFCYSLRVTTKGQFAVPPIEASCMYDPAIASLAQAGVIQVSE